MKKIRSYIHLPVLLILLWSCSNESDPEPKNDCSLSTLAITAQSTKMSSCLGAEGEIVAMGSGGEGVLNYSLDGGPFQSGGEFQDLSPGTYEVKVKDDNGCIVSMDVAVLSGISFSAEIKPIIEKSCALNGCHDGSSNLPNFLVFSNIQVRAQAAKSRTQSGDMPRTGSLNAEEIAKIACWADDGAPDN